MKTRYKPKGIFCLEGDWWGVKDKTTVEPVLELLQKNKDYHVPYIHRDVGTIEEFEHYITKWSQKGLAKYPILYLAFHGDSGVIYAGSGRQKKKEVPLVRLAELLEGRCKGQVIVFGSCDTLKVHGKRLNTFARRTGAVAVFGYRESVDWVTSSAFELLLLGQLQQAQFTKRGMIALKGDLRKVAGSLVRKLKFHMVFGTGGTRRRSS